MRALLPPRAPAGPAPRVRRGAVVWRCDAVIEIVSKEMELFPAPHIASLASTRDRCVRIEYEFVKLEIPDAPHIVQRIEIAAVNQTHPNADDIFECIILDDSDKDSDADVLDEIYQEVVPKHGDNDNYSWDRRIFEFAELGAGQQCDACRAAE